MARKVDKTVKMCVICGDKAKGVNFNVLTCMSCKAFFRRNALRKKEMKCPFNDNCQIDKITRKFCSKCRLKKCFESGMKKEWILSDEEKQLIKEKIIRNKLRKQQQELERQNNVSTLAAGNGMKSGRINSGRRNNNNNNNNNNNLTTKTLTEKSIKGRQMTKGNNSDQQTLKQEMGNNNYNFDISVKYQHQINDNDSFYPMMYSTLNNNNQQSRLSSLNNVNNNHINDEFILSQFGTSPTLPITNSGTGKYISLSNASSTSRICGHFTEPSAYSLDTLLTSNESDIFLDNESTSSLSFNVNNHHYHNYVNNNHYVPNYDYVPQIHGSLTNLSTGDDPNDDELFSSYIHHSIIHSNHHHHYHHHSILNNNISMNNGDNNEDNINLNMNEIRMENIFDNNNNNDDESSHMNGIMDYNYKYNNDELIISSPFGINDLELDVGLRFGSSSISSSLSDCCFLFSTNNSIDSIDFFNNPQLENLELNNNNNNNDSVCGNEIGIKDIDPLLNNGKKNSAIISRSNATTITTTTTTTNSTASNNINTDSNTIIDNNNNNNAGNQSSIINVDCKSSITNIDNNNNNKDNANNKVDGLPLKSNNNSNNNNNKDIQPEFKFLTDYLSRNVNGTNENENKSVNNENEKTIRIENRNGLDGLNKSSNLLNVLEKDRIDEDEENLMNNIVNHNGIVGLENGDNENSLDNNDKITIENDKIIINNNDDETNNVEDFSQYLLHDNDPPLTFQQQQNVQQPGQLTATVMNTLSSSLSSLSPVALASSTSSTSSPLSSLSSSSSSSPPLSTPTTGQIIMDTTGLAAAEIVNSFPFIPSSLSPTLPVKLLPTTERFCNNRNPQNYNHFKQHHHHQSIYTVPKTATTLKDIKKTPRSIHEKPKNLLSIFNETELVGGIKNGIDCSNERLDNNNNNNNNNCNCDQSSSIFSAIASSSSSSSVDLDQMDCIVNENINNKIRNNNNNTCEYISRPIAIANNELILPERCLIQELSSACSLLKNPYKRTIYVTSIYQHSHNCKISEFFLHRLIRMSKRLSSFSSLLLDDQIQLLKQGLIEMLCLRSVLLYDPDREAFNFLDDKCKLSILVDIELIKPTHLYLNCELKNFPQRFMHEWKTDNIIFNLMTAIILFTPRPELREKDRIKEEYLRYKYLLRRYLEIKYNNRVEATNTFSLLMLRIEEVRLLNLDITQMLINQHQLSSSPLFVQLLNLDNQKFASNHNNNNNNNSNNNNNNNDNVFNDLDNKTSNNAINTNTLASNDNVKMESSNGIGNSMSASNMNHHQHHQHHHNHHHQTIHQY